MIICKGCKQEKDDTDFNFRNRSKGIRQYYCKMCSRKQGQSHYNKNKQQVIQRSRANRNRGNFWYTQFKNTLECMNCGENHPSCLEFHHMSSVDKQNEPSNIYKWETFKREISQCIVVCANCHRKIHSGVLSVTHLCPSSLMNKALVFETSKWKFDSSLGHYNPRLKV